MSYQEGTWGAEVLGAMLTVSSQKKTPQVAIEFRLMDGPDQGSKIIHYAAVTEGRLKYTVEELRTCGWTGDDLEDLSTVKAGTPVELVLAEEEYNGRVNTKVRFINAPGRKPPSAPAGIGAEWRAKIAALAKPEKDPFE